MIGNGQIRKIKDEKECPLCFKWFESYPSEKKTYCSYECYWASLIKKIKYRYSPCSNWEEIRASIVKRDNYTCRSCKKKDLKLDVHHIIPCSILKHNEPKLLIALCKSCHMRIDHEVRELYKLNEKKFNKIFISNVFINLKENSVTNDNIADAFSIAKYVQSEIKKQNI